MKLTFAFILSIVISLNSWAQDSLNFKTVDATTYQAYLEKNWKKVIKIGNEALKQDIDYYFLRMRLGIAYYERENYRKAIAHFEKAKEMSTEDVVIIEYLYYAYKFIGDDIQAIRTLDRSNTKFGNKLLAQQKIFQNIYSFYGSRIYDANQLENANLSAYKNEITQEKKPIYTEQFIPNSYSNFQLGANIRFSPSWRLNVSYQYFNVKKEQYILDPFQKITDESTVTQTQWNFNNSFGLSKYLKASVFFSYLSQKYNYIDINTDLVPTKYQKFSNVENKDFLFGIGLNYQQSYFDIGLSASALASSYPTNQIDLELKIFPLGNRKIISRTAVSSLISDTTGRRLIFSQELSYNPIERINLSLVGNWGEMNKWNTNNGYNIYNGIYGISSLYQAKISVRIVKQLYVKLYYEYMKNHSNIWSKSLVPEDSEQWPTVIEKVNFNTHSIIGGLIWEF